MQAKLDEFENLDRQVETISSLRSEATWPEGEQGEFLGFLAGDLVEFAIAIQCEARAERWTTALALGRSMHERQEYLLAAAIDAGFWDAYKSRMQKRIADDYRGKSRLLSELARGVIRRWENERHGTQHLLELGLRVHATSSELLHHAIGVSWLAAQDAQHRALFLANVETALREACSVFLLALEVIGDSGREIHRRTWTLVTGSASDGEQPKREP